MSKVETVPTFFDFPVNEPGSNFHFLLCRYKYTYSSLTSLQQLHTTRRLPAAADPIARLQRDMASRVAALLVGLICVGFAAGKTLFHSIGSKTESHYTMLSVQVYIFGICFSIFPQPKLCWTAVSTSRRGLFPSTSSRATSFRKLGRAATKAPLCKCQMFTSVCQKKRLEWLNTKLDGGSLACSLGSLLCFSSALPGSPRRLEDNCASPTPANKHGCKNTSTLWRREIRDIKKIRYCHLLFCFCLVYYYYYFFFCFRASTLHSSLRFLSAGVGLDGDGDHLGPS